MDRKVEQYIKEFEENVIKQHECLLVGDWKAGNKAAKKIHNAFKKIRELDAIDQLFLLTTSTVPKVQSMSAVFCLPVFTEECLAILTHLKNQNIQLVSMGAEQTIKNWYNGDYHLWDE